jgi:hypothetical protein
MSTREAVLFIHLASMAIFLMTLGIETLAVARLTASTSAEEAKNWLAPLRSVLSLDQYALIAVFLTGGYLIQGLPKDQQPGFIVTVVMFLLISGLTGMAAGRYRRMQPLAAGGTNPAPFLRASLILRIALVLGILLLVSAKPDLAVSFIVFAVFAVLGVVAARFGMLSRTH